MTKQIVAYLAGAAFASAWWVVPFIPTSEDWGNLKFAIPVIATIAMGFLAGYFFVEHWDD